MKRKKEVFSVLRRKKGFGEGEEGEGERTSICLTFSNADPTASGKKKGNFIAPSLTSLGQEPRGEKKTHRGPLRHAQGKRKKTHPLFVDKRKEKNCPAAECARFGKKENTGPKKR